MRAPNHKRTHTQMHQHKQMYKHVTQPHMPGTRSHVRPRLCQHVPHSTPLAGMCPPARAHTYAYLPAHPHSCPPTYLSTHTQAVMAHSDDRDVLVLQAQTLAHTHACAHACNLHNALNARNQRMAQLWGAKNWLVYSSPIAHPYSTEQVRHAHTHACEHTRGDTHTWCTHRRSRIWYSAESPNFFHMVSQTTFHTVSYGLSCDPSNPHVASSNCLTSGA